MGVCEQAYGGIGWLFQLIKSSDEISNIEHHHKALLNSEKFGKVKPQY